MDFFTQTYANLKGSTGAPQTPSDTIARLADRLSPSTLLADRRAAVLALKGLARDCKADVGERALTGLLQVLENDASIDPDICKAVLETLSILCDTDDSKELGFKHSDIVLANEKPTHTLFTLLGEGNFYSRFPTLQFLATLLQNRRQVVQAYFLNSSDGHATVIAVLDDTREMVRNEGISMIQRLISHSPDIQKILTFGGAFEKLFHSVKNEGGVDGGIVVQDALGCVDNMLRYNTSNQSYFRETPLVPLLRVLLQFPAQIHTSQPAPQEFALQFWDEGKLANASLVVNIIGVLLASKGSNPSESAMFARMLVELALASNAPTPLKSQALRLLPATVPFSLSDLILTPYMPVPESNGEEWDRLEPCSALDALVELALHGEYNGLDAGARTKEGLELRSEAVKTFENFVTMEEIKIAIVQAMLPPEGSDEPPPLTPLLHSLVAPLDSNTFLNPALVSSKHFASFLFTHLLRACPESKKLARAIKPPPSHAHPGDAGQFFVPADGPPVSAPSLPEVEDDEPPQALLQILTENLSLSLLSRSRSDKSEDEAREWDRLVVAYLCLLSQWLWEDTGAVREFLDSGGLGVLVEPINQFSEMDSVVPGLCVFLLGICYEYNREPGEITRSTIHPILHRLGVETLIGRMTRLREDERFKAIGPDSIVLSHPASLHQNLKSAETKGREKEKGKEGEIWFDWAFVDFWKSNHNTIQRALSSEPDQLSASSSGQTAETSLLIASLKDVIRTQATQIEELQKRLKASATPTQITAPPAQNEELIGLREQVKSLTERLKKSDEARKEAEKEQEDLLVLLDELSTKRKGYKERLRDAGLEVSEEEDDDDDDEDGEEE